MTLLVNSFEGGTNTTAISTGNSGGASGNAFDVIGSTAPTFSSTWAAHGSLSAHSAGGYCEWTTSMGTQTQVWFRMYLYLAVAPAGTIDCFYTRDAAVTSPGSIQMTSGRVLELVYQAGTLHSMTTLVPLNQWIRLEGFITGSATVGQMALNMYLTMDSTTADESYTSAATLNTLAALTGYWFGSSSAASPFWMDDIGLSSTGYIGPVASITGAPTSLISYQQAVMAAATR